MSRTEKLIILMFSAFIAVLLFTTCDRRVVENDGISVECMELNDFELLYSDIKQLTNDHITNNGVQTRGIFGKILACVLADGFGFWVGGLDAAIKTSTLAYAIASADFSLHACSNSRTLADAIIPEREQGIIIDKNSAGYIHNLTIENVYIENGKNLFFKLSEKEQLKLLHEKSKEIQASLNYVSYNEKSEDEIYSIAKTISQELNPILTTSEYATKLKSIYNSEESKVIIDIVSTIISGLESSSDDREVYIKKIEEAIKSSSLSKEDKLRLNDVVSVTYASSALWNSKISLK